MTFKQVKANHNNRKTTDKVTLATNTKIGNTSTTTSKTGVCGGSNGIQVHHIVWKMPKGYKR